MHMADALLSPAVGGTMWVVSAGMIAACSRTVRRQMDDSTVPLMGVLGAFIFAAQMVNFTIPLTGSSGHLGGGLILAILLGPHAAFLTIASILTIQALFFADGGLLALGGNIFNLGFFPAFIAYPLIYKKCIGDHPTALIISLASLLAAVVGLQMGAFAVVLETVASGISSLPLATFSAVMQPVHLAIGISEGLITASIITFVRRARPEIMQGVRTVSPGTWLPANAVAPLFLVAALVTGGFVSQFASQNPDGLEWSISRITGQNELRTPDSGLQGALKKVQKGTSFLPDYAYSTPSSQTSRGTGVAGLTGGIITLLLVFLIGFILKRRAHPTGVQG